MSIVAGITKGSAYISSDNLNCWYATLSAGTLIFTSPVTLYGIIVNSTSSGVVTLWDGITPQTTPIGGATVLPAAGSFYNLAGITTGTALTIEIAGTANAILAYRKTKDSNLQYNP